MSILTVVLLLTCAVSSYAQKSCQARCFDNFNTSQPCQCNTFCERYEDCCSDFFSLCRGPENCHRIAAADLASAAQHIYDADDNRVDGALYQLNFQQRYHTGVDNPLPFFTRLDESILQKSTYALMSALEDNFVEYVHTQETYNDTEWAEIQTFIEAVINTKPMAAALDFLATHGCISNNTEARKTLLEELWFNLYPGTNSHVADSSGFEHVFLGELQGQSVIGLNNWLEYYKEEQSGRINYLGWRDYMTNPNIVSISFVWAGAQAPTRSFFVGTSPEFDMAVATLCALARTSSLCPLTINGKSFTFQTVGLHHRQELQIAAAYPIVPAHSAPANATGEDLVG